MPIEDDIGNTLQSISKQFPSYKSRYSLHITTGKTTVEISGHMDMPGGMAFPGNTDCL